MGNNWKNCSSLTSFPNAYFNLSAHPWQGLRYMEAMWEGCTNLVCIGGSMRTDLAASYNLNNDIFNNCINLQQPDANAQADLTDSNGAVWTNTNPCP